MKKFLKSRFIIYSFVFTYLSICFFVYAIQRQLIYAPNNNIQSPNSYGLADFNDLLLKAEDGTIIQVWHHEAKKGFPTVIYFHGKTGNLKNNTSFFDALAKSGFGVLGLSYRGYGASQGSPTEKGLYLDARAIIHYALQTLKLSHNQIILYGKSLGTGVAVQMATEFTIAALVLQSPYTSIVERGKERYPWLPISFFLKDRFESIHKIKNVHTPILLFHGELDSIVPIKDGKKIFTAANFPKKAVYFPKKTHDDFNTADLLEPLLSFTRELKLIP